MRKIVQIDGNTVLCNDGTVWERTFIMTYSGKIQGHDGWKQKEWPSIPQDGYTEAGCITGTNNPIIFPNIGMGLRKNQEFKLEVGKVYDTENKIKILILCKSFDKIYPFMGVEINSLIIYWYKENGKYLDVVSHALDLIKLSDDQSHNIELATKG